MRIAFVVGLLIGIVYATCRDDVPRQHHLTHGNAPAGRVGDWEWVAIGSAECVGLPFGKAVCLGDKSVLMPEPVLPPIEIEVIPESQRFKGRLVYTNNRSANPKHR